MKDLPIYLNDHLAGSLGALQMLEDIIAHHEGKPLEPFLKVLRDDIAADQKELKQLIQYLGIDESSVRKAGAWVAEKLSRAKLGVGDSGEPNLELLQSLESLSLGITGKRWLWHTLGQAAASAPRLSGFDFARLEKRAADQFDRVETQILEIAGQIFLPELNAPAHEGKSAGNS